MGNTKILILEHDPNDIELIQYELKKSSLLFINKVVENEEEYHDALLHFEPDVILSDYNLPNYDGIKAFRAKQLLLPEIPLLIVSGTIGEQRAVDLIRLGITDFVLKANLYQIPIKIERALQEVKDRQQKKQAECLLSEQNERIKNILESITDGFFSVTSSSIVNYWNQEAENLLGKKANEILNKNIWEEFNYSFSDKFYNQFQKVLKTQRASVFEEFYDPLQLWLRVNAYPSKDGLSFFIKNISETKRVEYINELEKEVLAIYTTKDLNIEAAIEYLIIGIQKIHTDLICHIDKVEDGFLYPLKFSHLPSIITSQLTGIPIGNNGMANSIAAYTKTKYTVENINEAHAYQGLRELTIDHQLRTCISVPALNTTQQCIGTFSVFLKSIRDLTIEEEKTIEKAVLILQHILENHLAELAIQESAKIYKKLFRLNPLPMWVYDLENLQFLNVNNAAINHYGYSKEEFLNMNLRDLVTPESQDHFDDIQHDIKGSKPIEDTIKHMKKNGEIIHVTIQSNFIHYSKRKARLVLINDVTEKIKAKEALQLNELRFKALVQEGSDLINILDASANLTYSNPSFLKLTEKNSCSVIGKNAFEYIHDDDKKVLMRGLNLINRRKSIEKVTFRIRDSEGNFRWIESTVTNLFHNPAIQGILINSKDITEKVNHINAIELQNSKLREIAWTQSHIVRAPLARILGLTDLILDSQDDQEELLQYLKISAMELDEVFQDIVLKSEEVKNLNINEM